LFSETDERLLTFDAKAADRYSELVAARELPADQSQWPTRSSPALHRFIARLSQLRTAVTSKVVDCTS
jgi:hypothetical protein